MSHIYMPKSTAGVVYHSDAELRAMRETVYPAQCAKQIQDDASWAAVKDAWRRDEAWLLEQLAKMPQAKI